MIHLLRSTLCAFWVLSALPALASLPEEFWARRQSVAIEAGGPDALVAQQRAVAAGLRVAWQAMARRLDIRGAPDDAALRLMAVYLVLENQRTTPTGFAATLVVEFDMAMASAFRMAR